MRQQAEMRSEEAREELRSKTDVVRQEMEPRPDIETTERF
jgi:hypothetical protein